MKFTETNHYQQQIKLLRFSQNWNRDKEAGYKRIFKPTSIGVAAISNRWRCQANKVTNFTAQTKADAITDTTSH